MKRSLEFKSDYKHWNERVEAAANERLPARQGAQMADEPRRLVSANCP